jgi:hypothetical protein
MIHSRGGIWVTFTLFGNALKMRYTPTIRPLKEVTMLRLSTGAWPNCTLSWTIRVNQRTIGMTISCIALMITTPGGPEL